MRSRASGVKYGGKFSLPCFQYVNKQLIHLYKSCGTFSFAAPFQYLLTDL